MFYKLKIKNTKVLKFEVKKFKNSKLHFPEIQVNTDMCKPTLTTSSFSSTLSQIVYVLKECVWNYMKDHVPSPVLFVCDPTGFHWRDPASSRPPPQYTNPLRNTMQKRLPKMGTLYQQMFVGPELRNPTMMHHQQQPPPQQIVMVNGLGGSGQPQPMVAAANGNGNMMVMQHHHPHPHQHLPQQQHHHGQMGPGMVGANGNGHLMGNPGPPVILGPVVTLD